MHRLHRLSCHLNPYKNSMKHSTPSPYCSSCGPPLHPLPIPPPASYEYLSTKHVQTSSSQPPPFSPLGNEAAAAWQKELCVFVSPNGLVEIELNRHGALNALSMDMVVCMGEYLHQLKTDQRCKAVLVRGAGEKAFCAGGDVRSIAKADFGFVQRFFSREYLMDFRTSNIEKPYVSIWKGIVMGGGCGVSMHGRFRVSTDNTTFALPETGIGLIPDVGASCVLSRLRDGLGLYIGLTGARLGAGDLMRAGLATHFVSIDKLPSLLSRLKTEELGEGSSQNCKAVENLLGEFSSDVTVSPKLTDEMLDKVKQHFASVASLEELMERLRSDNHEFCKRTVMEIESKCPLSCAVWFKQHAKGCNISLAQALQMEYLLVQSFVLFGPNFKEGVRALLIDKDGKPNWNPQSIKAVTEDLVNEMFECRRGESLENFVDLTEGN